MNPIFNKNFYLWNIKIYQNYQALLKMSSSKENSLKIFKVTTEEHKSFLYMQHIKSFPTCVCNYVSTTDNIVHTLSIAQQWTYRYILHFCTITITSIQLPYTKTANHPSALSPNSNIEIWTAQQLWQPSSNADHHRLMEHYIHFSMHQSVHIAQHTAQVYRVDRRLFT